MASLHKLFFVLIILNLVLLSSSSSSPMEIKPTELIQEVCNKSSNYSFCVKALYSDERAPEADQYVLAYICFAVAFKNVTTTQSQIDALIKNATGSNEAALKQCRKDYKKAYWDIVRAHNELDSESFSSLPPLAKKAGYRALDCEGAFNGTSCKSPLTQNNHDLKSLSDICGVILERFMNE